MKAMVLGIDGGSLEILRPMADRGWLPVLAGLMEKGACGHLTSTIPPITGAAWTSFATGCHPGNHGLVDFVAPRPGSYRPTKTLIMCFANTGAFFRALKMRGDRQANGPLAGPNY